MVLNWKRPLKSGGSKVSEYYIDKSNMAKNVWKEVNIPPIKERIYKVGLDITSDTTLYTYCSILYHMNKSLLNALVLLL